MATTTLTQLTRQGHDQPVWRVVGHGEDRPALDAVPKARCAPIVVRRKRICSSTVFFAW
ncbi:hypothetical protein [Streptomyces sp. DSM 40750]|uniref:hypothetical protein n=1 Tax=Streptomyces sp. DSM 40750 TaxID=2801030 RepID=UPI00214CD2B5|nr:hypothetical protein [Streptomyces sp. DSM 40750]UUU19060.1 hypothetical protein JIX55_01200 [Streptomyces sp. DSM 40750]UUU27596.1 hypothetical protein JIX55_49545 [Streptomyces sp. DSM 40750]